ncbi:MAG: Tim44 domain-containing protein [Deltaproteobacteria bacterium]|nr:Tim44 domain-containing protein [Deltaproteobacteria bacterium]
MKQNVIKVFVVVAAVLFMSITVLELSADARFGGSRSFGSRGSRSYSRPGSNYSQPSRTQQQVAPSTSPYQQRAGGSFLRNMAGGIMGGMLGSMLFSRFAGAGTGGMGGGGIGPFDIALLAGIVYLIYRFVKKKSADRAAISDDRQGYQDIAAPLMSSGQQINEPATDQVNAGLAYIRQMDASFDQSRFNDMVMDMFFKIQGGWMNRDLSSVSGLLTDEIAQVFQEEQDRLLRDKQVNRLENIAVRKVDIAEAWQESGQDYITASIYANLLDYTTDDETGAVVSGSKTEPVKFEEYWTFTRPVGNNLWRLSAIQQK